jgi:hypothetical protein
MDNPAPFPLAYPVQDYPLPISQPVAEALYFFFFFFFLALSNTKGAVASVLPFSSTMVIV